MHRKQLQVDYHPQLQYKTLKLQKEKKTENTLQAMGICTGFVNRTTIIQKIKANNLQVGPQEIHRFLYENEVSMG